MKIVWAILLIGYIKIVLVHRVYNLVPPAELRRRAREDARARKIYKVAATQPALDILLWIVGVATASILLVGAANHSWWLATLFIIFTGWLFVWAPHPRVDGWSWRVAAFAAPYYFKIITWLSPLLNVLGALVPETRRYHFHSGLYEKEDLLELLNKQRHQIDNRVSEQDLKIARGALSFGDKLVRDVMTPRKNVRFVTEDESIGPMLMDELHKTGHMRFPVVKEIKKNAEPEVIGTLFLADLIGREDGGPVTRLIKKSTHYINESDNLEAALDAFIKTRAPLLVVVNNFEEVSGVLMLDDILGQILGRKIDTDFNDWHNLEAVAGRSDIK